MGAAMKDDFWDKALGGSEGGCWIHKDLAAKMFDQDLAEKIAAKANDEGWAWIPPELGRGAK